MKQLLLSGQNLNQQKVLETGTLDVFQLLEQQTSKNDWIEVRSDLPKGSLMLEWKEVRTPVIPTGLRDLVGKKMMAYNFQYIGRFSYNGVVLSNTEETFEANFPKENIHNNKNESEGWVNCTWLIDCLMNSAKIGQDSLRKELLIWDKNPEGYELVLGHEAIDYQNGEQQKFVFSEGFDHLTWQHLILFGN